MRCVQLQEKKAMIENCGRWDFDFIPPVDTISITLNVSPLELGLHVRYVVVPRNDERDRRRHGGRSGVQVV